MWSACCLALVGFLALVVNVAAAPAASAAAAPEERLAREASEEMGARELPLEDDQTMHLPNTEAAVGRPPVGAPATGWAADPQHMWSACVSLECKKSGQGDCPRSPPGISATTRMCRQFKWILAQAQKLPPIRAPLLTPAPGKQIWSSGYPEPEGTRLLSDSSGQKDAVAGVQDDPDWPENSGSTRAMGDPSIWQVIRKLIDMVLDEYFVCIRYLSDIQYE